MKGMLFVFLAFMMTGCGAIDLPGLDSLYSRQPRVVSVEPTDGATAEKLSSVAVEFSQPVDPSTVDSSSLAIVRLDDESTNPEGDVVKGERRGLAGVYEFAGEGRVAVFRALEPYESGATYRVIATDSILSTEMLPLAGRSGTARAAFTSEFIVGEERAGGEDAHSETGEAPGQGSPAAGGGEQAATVPNPSFLVINELLYDVPGDDTNGEIFIELFGEALTSIGGYKIAFINGDNGKPTKEITIPEQAIIPEDGIFLIADSMTGQSGVSQLSDADLIENFDPQNGPDCVQILDGKGELVDSLGYGTPITTPAANGKGCFENIPALRVSAGSSLSRNQGLDTDDNSLDFISTSTPTPGIL